MGSGKSSIGRRLARLTGWPRYDTDEMVARALARPVVQIFAELGEERFREEETSVLRKLETGTRSIIVTGGGIVLRPENVARLRELGTVVCLKADLATLIARLRRRSDRPLLQTDDVTGTVERLLCERRPHYLAAADFTVETTGLDHDQVVQAIEEAVARAS